jgi:hypothetical protein
MSLLQEGTVVMGVKIQSVSGNIYHALVERVSGYIASILPKIHVSKFKWIRK